MGSKQKGSTAERDLLHLFWATGDWVACRVAGSGSMKYPSPDIIANKQGMHLAIECKTTKSNYQYFEQREIDELSEYAGRAGARALVAIRFARQPWMFLDLEDLKKTTKNYVVTPALLDLRGLTFEELTKSL